MPFTQLSRTCPHVPMGAARLTPVLRLVTRGNNGFGPSGMRGGCTGSSARACRNRCCGLKILTPARACPSFQVRSASMTSLLMQADGPREGDRDGRGNLTQRGLIAFCPFFLDRAIDQVCFMSDLLEPEEMLRRMEIHIEEEVRAKRLPRGSYAVLREAALAGEVPRGKVGMLTNYEEHAARMVSAALLDRGMLTSLNHRAPLRLGFPAAVAERWFPRLYPVGLAD
jgi:hypothetical protein